MLDLLDAIAELLEPVPTLPDDADPETWTPATFEFHGHEYPVGASGVIRDDSGAEPFDFLPGWLYAFGTGDTRSPTGAGPEDRQDFEITAVYSADAEAETGSGIRTRDLTAALDAKRDGYLRAVRECRNGYVRDGRRTWEHLIASADFDYLRTFGVRGVAIRLEGWRLTIGGLQ
jgi:hypothetical protein